MYTHDSGHMLFDIVFILVLISHTMVEINSYSNLSGTIASSGIEMGWGDMDVEKIS